MSAWESFIRTLGAEFATTPGFTSPIYYGSIIILVALTVGLVFLNKKMNQVAYKYTLLGLWIVMFVMEIFKQIYSCYDIGDTSITFSYKWYNFPFHPCSMSLYLLPVIIFLKEGVVKKRFELFGAMMFVLGGLIGFFVPSYVAAKYICFQTMIHHGFMILAGVLIGLRNKDQFNIINFWQASLIYIGLLIIALFLNWLIPYCCPAAESRLNIFFVSWRNVPPVPLLNTLWNALVPKMGAGGYVLYLLIYLVGIAAAFFILFILLSLIYAHKITFVPKQTNGKLAKANNGKKEIKKTSKSKNSVKKSTRK